MSDEVWKIHIEPVANNADAALDHKLNISQAISLKRIADALERWQVPDKQPVWLKNMLNMKD